MPLLRRGELSKSSKENKDGNDRSLDARITLLKSFLTDGISAEFSEIGLKDSDIIKWNFPHFGIHPIGSINTAKKRADKWEVIKELRKELTRTQSAVESKKNHAHQDESIAKLKRQIRELKDELQKSTNEIIKLRAERLDRELLLRQYSCDDQIRRGAIRRHHERWGLSGIACEASNDSGVDDVDS